MLTEIFSEVYTKFKLHFYQETFRSFQDRDLGLTTMETFCVESIMALGRPSINEFASFMHISPPNAAYKISSLLRKGYVRKVQSSSDRRTYHLEVTSEYTDYYNISAAYMARVMDRIQRRIPGEDCQKLEEILTIISQELMPEIRLPAEVAQR